MLVLEMISKAFIQEIGHGKLDREEERVAEELEHRKIPITFYTEKRIHRRQLPLDSKSLVVGNMPCILGALQQLSIPAPKTNDYPNSLSDFLHRPIWISNLASIETSFQDGTPSPIFAKPATRRKRFSGGIFASEYDLSLAAGVSRQDKLICSEVVTWLSEYRVYVVNSDIRSIAHYDGDPDIQVDRQEIQKAIQALDNAGESYAGYAIDFGVLASGETALVEMNDGFALGAYNIDSKNYTDLLLARWTQLLQYRQG